MLARVAALLFVCLLSAAPLRAEDPAPTPTPTPGVAGWSVGRVAEGTTTALAPGDPIVLEIPADLAARVTGETGLFYFSPTCPHCLRVTPEVDGLARRGDMAWIGVVTGSATPQQIQSYVDEFKPAFEIWVDRGQTFAQSVGARETPDVFVVRPAEPGAALTAEPVTPGGVPIAFVDAYAPYGAGSAPVLTMRRHPEEPFKEFRGYLGESACTVCHLQEGRSMALTWHTMAWRTLWEARRDTDLACLSCHVTALGEPGGFDPSSPTSTFASVTCEACHGPSGPHDGERTDARAACARCHDGAYSIAFDAATAIPHIDHFAANALTDDEMLTRVQDLLDGVADRPMTAFPQGPTVGAAVCKTCHKAAWKNWSKHPHGKAMATLGADDGERTECVRCHATPTEWGGLGQQATAWRTDESVGCEACHGPGGAHAAAPTADNIVALGGKCTECVVEGLCTTCHTPRWDPNWKLKPRLSAIEH